MLSGRDGNELDVLCLVEVPSSDFSSFGLIITLRQSKVGLALRFVNYAATEQASTRNNRGGDRLCQRKKNWDRVGSHPFPLVMSTAE